MIRSGPGVSRSAPPTRREGVAELRGMIEDRLPALAPGAGSGSPLAEAAAYALLAPGKRTRPVMTLLCTRRFGGSIEAALDAACAFEMVHAASLVFDDLPCMDNALQRRGRTTTHLTFGEDAAVLAGVALLNGAFGVLAQCETLPDATARRLVATLADAIGPAGLTGGQMRDLRERSATADSLETLNHGKTGALFCAAAEAGAIMGGASPAEAKAVCAFARHVGAAFQLRDDLLDGASADVAGKDVGQDAGKPTYVSLLGVEGARRLLAEHKAAANAALASIGGDGELGAFSDRMLAVEWLKDAAAGGGVSA